MQGFTKEELTGEGFFSSLFGGKIAANAWKEINNALVDLDSALALDATEVKQIIKRHGAKCNEESGAIRSAIYRKVADRVYTLALSKDDALFQETAYIAMVLELPEHLVKQAEKGAKTAAYFARCQKILDHEEKLSIGAINELFGYDYEDGLAIRKQVFQSHFNNIFHTIAQKKRFSEEEEQLLRQDCAALDIPYEFKSNIANALEHYRQLWTAETKELGNIPVNLPLRSGEICRAYANAGACERKTVEREDDLRQVNRRFEIDETVTFAGEKLQNPTLSENMTVVVSIGYFFLTNQRIIYMSQKNVTATELNQLEGADFDGSTLITFRSKQGDLLYKFSDEAADAMYIIFGRVFQDYKASK